MVEFNEHANTRNEVRSIHDLVRRFDLLGVPGRILEDYPTSMKNFVRKQTHRIDLSDVHDEVTEIKRTLINR